MIEKMQTIKPSMLGQASFSLYEQKGKKKPDKMNASQDIILEKQKNNRMNESESYREDLYLRFQNFNIEQSFMKIKQQFKDLIGRHTAIDYQQKFNFKERWEQETREQTSKGYEGTLISFLKGVIQLILMNVCMWGISIYAVFDILQFYWVSILVVILAVEETIKSIFWSPKSGCEKKTKQLLRQAINILFSVLLVEQLGIEIPKIVQVLMAFFIFWNFYHNSAVLYENFKIYHFPEKYREIVNIFDLFYLLATVTHLFALILFIVTKANPHSNWILTIQAMQDHNWDTEYIYSIYFSCTTLLTVGYGDISPSNKTEIFAILLTQIIGIATFAYAVNEIGSALSSIHRKREKLNKDLANVQRIGNQYQLEPDVLCRMRNQLMRNAAVAEELGVEEQNELLGKFSDDLRTNIQLESSLKVIKRSLFMICNWTGKFQAKIASKLIKEIYTPEQFLPENPGKQKIYILERGRIDILNNTRNSHRLGARKVLKTIKVKKQTEIAVQNVYGYSAVISHHKINLKAISKENSIVYSLCKHDFYEVLQESEEDLQHLHEIKSKIDLSRVPEEIQAPLITNLREHFRPSHHFLIMQYAIKNHKKNMRTSYLRKPSRSCLLLKEGEQLVSFTEKAIKLGAGGQGSAWQRIDTGIGGNGLKYNDEVDDIYTSKQIVQLQDFEACKQFQRFFKKSNFDQIVKKLNILNYVKKPNNIRISHPTQQIPSQIHKKRKYSTAGV